MSESGYRVAWLVPRLIAGSGGHRTIFQHAAALEAAGMSCQIYLEGPAADRADASAEIEKLFGYGFKSARYGWDSIADADLVFATVWHSAKVVRDLRGRFRKAYFVQDYEACFNPMGDAYLLAENSYRYGLHPITIGRWLAHRLRSDFAIAADHFDFCADLGVYRPLERPRENTVCFVYQPEKPRRCAQLGLEALGIVKHHRPDTRIVLFGSTRRDPVWFEHQHLGLLKLDACNELYNRSAVGLCLSPTNPSRVPFEMMAAGLPVVELWRDSTRYDLPDSSTLLCDQTPESLAEGILRLLGDAPLRERMGAAGIGFMRERSLALAEAQFVSAVSALMDPSAPREASAPGLLYPGEAVVSQRVSPPPAAAVPARRRSWWARTWRKFQKKPR